MTNRIKTQKEAQVRDTNHKELKPNQIQVNHDNAPLLTVKLLELVLKEIHKLNQHFEKVNG